VVNPFWSERTREEAALQQSRPVDLPVPTGDEAELDQALQGETTMPENGPGEAATLTGVGEGSGKGRGNDGGKGERFSTPAIQEVELC